MRSANHDHEAFRIRDDLPESKLELIGGRLIVGNSLAGSRYLLWALLQTLGPRAALPLAPLDDWWAALATAFRAPPLLVTPPAWERWAAQVDHTPRIEATGPHFDRRHHEAYSLLMLGLYRVLREDEDIGRSIQRFVLRLGDDALMPDLQCFRRDRLHRLHSYYYAGPADLVIEVVLPGSEAHDTAVKRRLYAAGGVPEYVHVDAAARRWEWLRLTPAGYESQTLDADGRYRSSSLPGLMCDPARLWACLDDPKERRGLADGIFAVEPTNAAIGPCTTPNTDEDWSWEWRSFAPPTSVRPTPISFAQFIDWCPEAKFEFLDGKPHIGGWEGTRNVLGMLLMTFGLEQVVTLLHPQAWVAALLTEERNRQQDAARRDAWWSVARRTAALLRERFGVERVVVIGDLVRPDPLHFWSQLTLVGWNLPQDSYALYQALHELPDDPRIDLHAAERVSPRQQAAFAVEAVAL